MGTKGETKFQIVNNKEEKAPRAILAGLMTTQEEYRFRRAMDELADLARACLIEPVCEMTQRAANPVQSTYIGKGKVGEIKEALAEFEADLVIFDQTLSPMQFRNLGKELGVEVMDRTGLILRIFSDQAKTREARLQVEHAQLQYTMPRLAGMWTHFGRQSGSSGAGKSNRGIGETQLELDRRYIERRMAELEKELKAISRERATQREKRLASGLPRVALVGYTNAGKSTVMNRLLARNDNVSPEKKVLEEDKLFATLDTTVRKIEPKGLKPFLLSDTVGFINELPHSLVKAFRSTLEEVKYADLLLQIIDISDPDYQECMRVTEDTLKEIGAGGIPMLHVFNKTDLMENTELGFVKVRENGIFMAAGRETGIEELLLKIREMLDADKREYSLFLPYSRGDILARLREKSEVLESRYEGDGIYLRAKMAPAERERLKEFLK